MSSARLGGRSRLLIALILGVASATFAKRGAAQVIDGVVVDSDSRIPVAGALVSLVDGSGRDIQRFMVDADGSFRFLVAAVPGSYSLRAERLGMTTRTVDSFDLGPADTVTIRIALSHRPIALAGIQASGERRCELEAALGETTHQVWDRARTTLRAVGTSDSVGRYVYDLERHVRELEPRSLEIRSETRTHARSTDERPIRSHPVEMLVGDGWAVGDEAGGYRFFAPDAHTLLSDLFLATHCLRLRPRDESRPGLVGLEFRPISLRSNHTDIEGVLWLSRETGELLWLEFDYRGLPGLAADHRSDQVGGRVEFLGLPDGGWIVSKWFIRMPMMVEERHDLLGGRRARLAGIAEEGGRVVRAVRRGTGQVTYAELGGTVLGEVSGGVAGDGIALVGTGIHTALDESGGFAFDGLPEGSYRLAYIRPYLMGVDREYAVADARVLPGDTTTVRITAPPVHDVLAAACQVEEWNPRTGILVGDVSDGQGRALEDVDVVAEWVAVRNLSGRMIGQARTAEAVTNRLGEFRICGVPVDRHTITVTAGTGVERARTEVVLSPDEPVGGVSLRLAR